jgi:polyhydroxyalkanoate synthesis regulator phasin
MQFCFYAGLIRTSRRKEAKAMGLGDLVQKAVYLGIGVASYAGEKAGDKLNELRDQMQKMADEMVERGEMTAEEAKKFVDDTVKKAQQPGTAKPSSDSTVPRPIKITDEADPAPTAATVKIDPQPVPKKSTGSADDIDIATMRRQVEELQDELRRLRKP